MVLFEGPPWPASGGVKEEEPEDAAGLSALDDEAAGAVEAPDAGGVVEAVGAFGRDCFFARCLPTGCWR